MSNEDNPYINLIELIKELGSENNPIPYMTGKVISTNPLVVDIGEIQLGKEEILVNKDLILEIGDTVVTLVSANKQQFVLLCRVV